MFKQTQALRMKFYETDGLNTNYMLLTILHGPTECVADYNMRILSLTAYSDLGERYTKNSALRGLKTDLFKMAILAEQTMTATERHPSVTVVKIEPNKMNTWLEMMTKSLELQQLHLQQEHIQPE